MTADRRTQLKMTPLRWGAFAVIAVGLVTVPMALTLWGGSWLAALFIPVMGLLLMVAGALLYRAVKDPARAPAPPACGDEMGTLSGHYAHARSREEPCGPCAESFKAVMSEPIDIWAEPPAPRLSERAASFARRHANRRNALIGAEMACSLAGPWAAGAVRGRRAAMIAATAAPLLIRGVRNSDTLTAEVRCAGCGRLMQGRDLEVDHIQPQALGGGDDPANLQLLCTSCNRIKGARPMDYLWGRLDDIGGGP